MNLKNQALFLILGILLITGCRSSSDIKVNDGKVEPLLEHPSGVTTGVAEEAAKKETFDLPDLYALAVERTERLAIKAESVEQAKAQKKGAFGAFFPSLALTYQNISIYPSHKDDDRKNAEKGALVHSYYNIPYTPQELGLSTSGSSSSSLPPIYSSGTRLVLKVPIMTGLNEYSGYRSAKDHLEQTNHLLRREAELLYLDLAQTYYSILQSEQNLDSLQQVRKLTMDTLAELGRRVALGKSKRSDLLNTRSQLYQLDAEITSTESQLKQQRDSLSTMAGVDPGVKLHDAPILPSPVYTEADAIGKVDHRSDVQAARASLKMAEDAVIQAYGGHLPTVAFTGYYTPPELNRSSNRDIYGMFSVTLPLLSMNTVVAQVEQAKAGKRQAELQLSQTRRSAIEDIRKAYESYKDGQKTMDAYGESLEAAELNYRVQLQDYDRQLNTILDVMTALTTLENAKKQYTQAVLQQKLNRTWLAVATGELPVPGKSSEGNESKTDPAMSAPPPANGEAKTDGKKPEETKGTDSNSGQAEQAAQPE